MLKKKSFLCRQLQLYPVKPSVKALIGPLAHSSVIGQLIVSVLPLTITGFLLLEAT